MFENEKFFDPFDEKHRDKRTRRSSSQVAFDKKQWTERLDRHFERAIATLNKPKFAQSNVLLMTILSCPETNINERSIRYSTAGSMSRLGYRKVLNSGSKDGRWKACGESFFVYTSDLEERTKEFGKMELKQALEW